MSHRLSQGHHIVTIWEQCPWRNVSELFFFLSGKTSFPMDILSHSLFYQSWHLFHVVMLHLILFLCDVTQDRVVTDHASNVSLTSMPSWSPQWHLLPTVIFATNRGNTLIHGTTDTVAPHGIPTNLLDQCVLHYCPAWPLSYHFWLPVSDCENRWLCIVLPKFGSKLT